MGKVTRNRVIKSCQYCYAHKKKCDRNLPCANCVRLNNGDCIYHFNRTLKQTKSTALVASSENSTTLYHSQAFFPYLEPTMNKLFLFKVSGSENNDVSTKPHETGFYNFKRHNSFFSLEDVVDLFPSKEESDIGFEIYWHSVHPLVPVFDEFDIKQEYERFWIDLQDEEKIFDVRFGVILLALLFAATIAREVNEKDESKLDKLRLLKKKYYDIFEKFKVVLKLNANPLLSFVQASIVIFQSGCFNNMGIFSYAATLTRISEFLGLHRDPILHGGDPETNKIDAKVVQARRLAWHWIRLIDISTSITSGLSPHLVLINASAKYPSVHNYYRLKNDYVGDFNPFMLYNLVRFKSTTIFENICLFLNSDYWDEYQGIKKQKSILETVLHLYDEFYEIKQKIMDCNNNKSYLRWLVANANVYVHRTYLLYRACREKTAMAQNKIISKPADTSDINFEKLGQKKTNKEFLSGLLIMETPYAEDLVEVSILLLNESRIRIAKTEDFNRFRWAIKSATPFQSLFVVLRDIFNRPYKTYKFDNIPPQIQRYVDANLLLPQEDVRRTVVGNVIDALDEFKHFWPEPSRDFYSLLCKLRAFIWKHFPAESKVKVDSVEFDIYLDSLFEHYAYQSFSQVFNNINDDSTLFTDFSNGFWDFGLE